MHAPIKIDGNEILVFVSSVNTPGKADASGAFIPEALGFLKHNKIPSENIVYVDCVGTSRKIRVDTVIVELLRRKSNSLKAIVFFGHGWPSGIQFGFNKKNVDRLATVISSCCTNDVKIGLFACLTAENSIRDNERKRIGPATNGGFADLLRDNLFKNGITKGWVDGHKTAGHATWNPYVIRFLCESVDYPDFGAVGGGWIVEPGTKYWPKWVAALKNNTENLRYSYLFKEEFDIKSRLDDSFYRN